MSTFLLVVAILMGLLIAVGVFHMVRSRTIFDRAMAASLVAANGVVMIVLLGVLFDRLDMFVDIAIAYSLLAFILPVGFAAYFERNGESEP